MKKILLSPHNDDESLFASYIILREKPLVIIITDGYAQSVKRHHTSITPELRKQETLCAMKILGAKTEFFGISDLSLNHANIKNKLVVLDPDVVYAPYPNSKHEQHNLVGNVAYELWGDRVQFYATYTKQKVYTVETLAIKGDIEIKPTEEEKALKNKALDCYKSQLKLSGSIHFLAVRNKSEYLCKKYPQF